MSAFEVDNTHIDVMVSAALQCIHGDRLRWYHGDAETERGQALTPFEKLREGMREVTPENAETWGATLLAENRRSVNHRYDEDEIEAPYTFTEYAGTFDPVKMLSAIACYEYQAREHPEWKTSEAKSFCDALRSRLIHSLPGYGTPWEVTDAAQVTIGQPMRVSGRLAGGAITF